MFHVNAQGVDERMINVRYYYLTAWQLNSRDYGILKVNITQHALITQVKNQMNLYGLK